MTTAVKKENPYGEWLREKREALGWSQRTLSEQAREICSPSYIGQLETGYYKGKKGKLMQPDEDIVIGLARALGASVNEALGKAGYPVPDEDEGSLIARDFENTLHQYKRLSKPARRLVNRHFSETINFLLEAESSVQERGVITEQMSQQTDSTTSRPDAQIGDIEQSVIVEEIPEAELERHGKKTLDLKKKKSSVRKDGA